MNVLLQGGQSLKRLELLLQLTLIKSDNMKDALKSYLVDGMSESAVAALHSVDRNNFIRTLSKLNEKAAIVENIKEVDWPKYHDFVKSQQQVTTLKEVS
ncbi:MAG: hypothetical protein JKX67_07300 [Colwellia sp.]|nr:hypothetical protein [Colwellia sp.]